MKVVDNAERNLEIAPATWHTIRPHLNRDAVIVVSHSLELREVAEKIGADDTAVIQAWIDDGSVSKPSAQQIETWNQKPEEEFQCAIVQPFVLMQLDK